MFERFKDLLTNFLIKKSEPSKTGPDLARLNDQLEYKFKDEKIIFKALKHRSYLTITNEERIESNERLELLGDAVLGLVVTDFLYENYPNEEEGVLTTYRSLLVNRKMLSKIGKAFGLGDYVLLNEAEEKSGGRQRESIMSDLMESIIGAIYLDGGLSAAARFVQDNITIRLDEIVSNGVVKNYKSLLQEHCQSLGQRGPNYYVEQETGPDHDKTFLVSVKVNGEKLGNGEGPSKKSAEQRAAKEALIYLKVI